MKVWVLEGVVQHEGTNILGIYDSYGKALNGRDTYKQEHLEDERCFYDWYSIDPYELNKTEGKN
jgi:hypothetical protein